MRRFSTPLASTGIKTLRIFARSSREQSERERRHSRRRRGPLEEARLATALGARTEAVLASGAPPYRARCHGPSRLLKKSVARGIVM